MSRNPMNWEDYEYGRSPRHGSTDSLESHVQFEAATPPAASDRHHNPSFNREGQSSNSLRHRRSSLSIRINSIAQAGGANSLENFARSWSRAAGFLEIQPRTPSFVISAQGEDDSGSRQPGGTLPHEPRSLLRQQLEQEGTSPENVFEEDTESGQHDEEAARHRGEAHLASEVANSIRERAPYLDAPFASSYGTIYGSIPSRVNEPSLRHAEELYREQQMKGRQDPNKEQEPLLIKVVEQKDGTKVPIIIGRSTLPQTVFNSVNVLIGVGLLSLPLGLKQSGWLIGMTFLFCAALVTRYTARLLAKCLDVDSSLVSFSDIAWKAFGPKSRIATGVLFTLELLATCVALVVLFADSLNALIPGWRIVEWKIFCGIIVLPLGFVPLRYLSFTSVLGILSCLGIVILIFADGLIKPDSPGSLWHPQTAGLFPEQWSTLPMSFGLLMSPWGGHSVFPNIYRDMRHPKKYPRAINYTYVFTYLLDVSVAVTGFLMFGQEVLDEITANIFLTAGYPEALSVCIVVFIAIIPLSKLPLNARPIFNVLEESCGFTAHSLPPSRLLGLSNYARGFVRGGIRVFTMIIIVLLAIVVPSFDMVMALLGSAMAFSICIILPVGFHLKLFHHHIGETEKVFNWFLVIVSSVLAVVGTVWVFLPPHMRESLDGVRLK